jgi:hypothetical protein
MVTVTARTAEGGSVLLNKAHHVWASYAVAGVADLPASSILRAGATLLDGRAVQFFLNRETGLVVVDVVDKGGRGGVEVLRRTIAPCTHCGCKPGMVRA